jgi:hypothetical protein
MPSQLLNCLPREIRDQIYTIVLASPTGLLCLPVSRVPRIDKLGLHHMVDCFRLVPLDSEEDLPWNDESRIKLSLHRVCKQVHAEVESLLWQLNGIRLVRPTELRYFFPWPTLVTQLRQYLQYIEMDLELFQPRYFLDTQRALETFVEWSRK